jgi:predicted transcriptional regulator
MTNVKQLIEENNFNFKKKFGQNFLIDNNVLNKIVNDINIVEAAIKQFTYPTINSRETIKKVNEQLAQKILAEIKLIKKDTFYRKLLEYLSTNNITEIKNLYSSTCTSEDRKQALSECFSEYEVNKSIDEFRKMLYGVAAEFMGNPLGIQQ